MKSHVLYKTVDNRKTLEQQNILIAKWLDESLAARNKLYEANRKHHLELCDMKWQIKSLEEERSKLQEEKSKLQEQLQIAQILWVFDLLSWYCFSDDNHWNILLSGSLSDHIRLVAAAQVIVDMVDSEEGSSNSKSLVERLQEAPKKIFDVMTATSKNYLTHMIGVVKSYLPQFNLAPIAKGIAPDCSDEKFRDYCKESKVIAEEILKNLTE